MATVFAQPRWACSVGMRLVDGRYECSICGDILDVPEDMTETVEAAETASCATDEIVVNGTVIHRCGY